MFGEEKLGGQCKKLGNYKLQLRNVFPCGAPLNCYL